MTLFINRFGRVSLTDDELGYLQSSGGNTFNENFSNEQLRKIIQMVALRTGNFEFIKYFHNKINFQ